MISSSLFLLTLFSTQFGLTIQKQYETPKTGDFFLQNPLSFDLDSKGRLFIVDGEAKVIFCWDSNGHFLRTIGKPGQGPGEFTFSGHGPAMGFINIIKDQLFVFDGIQRKLSIFDSDSKFLYAPNLNLQRSRALYFTALSEKQFMFLSRNLMDDHFVSVIKVIDEEGKDISVLKEMKDDSIILKGANGQQSRMSNMTFKAFNPELVMGYNCQTETTYIGFSGEPAIEVLAKDGSSKKLKMPLVQREVTELDKDEFLLARTGSRQRTPTFVFPEKMPFFQNIFSMGNGDVLVFNLSNFTREIDGIVMDPEGNVKGKIQTTLGEGGGFLNARGLLLKFALNEDDEFEFALVSLRKKGA